MQGDKKIIKLLNQVLKNALTAINQYFLHARIYKNWGLKALNEHEYRASTTKMKHADQLIERILLLEGLPNLQDLGKLHIGENAKEILECGNILKQDTLSLLREAIKGCETLQDYVSRELLTEILKYEEEEQDWLEIQFDLIEKVGIQNYLQQLSND